MRIRLHPGYLIIALLYLVMIFLLSSKPGEPDGSTGPLQSIVEVLVNLAHVPLFAGLTCFLVMIVTGGQWNRRLSLGAYIAVVGVAGGMALLDEWHQYFVPDRCASVGDVALDSVGIASIVALHAYRRKAREAKPP